MHILNILTETDYRSYHTAPTKDSGDPLHNVAQSAYPEEIYTLSPLKAARYYGHQIKEDVESILIIQEYKDKPNKKVRMYRAVPKFLNEESKKLPELQKLVRYRDKFGFFPINHDIVNEYEKEFEHLSYDDMQHKIYTTIKEEIEKIKKLEKSVTINPGDWVTINKKYAINHGKGELGQGHYKVISKVVKAKDIYTNGDSIHEWGYDPQ